MTDIAREKKTMSFSDHMRLWFKNFLTPIAAFLNRIGLMPNTVTLFGLFGTTIGAILLAFGYITAGGIVIVLMAPIDALDGTMARLRAMPSKFGGFVDSVTDRYSELVIYAGLLIHYIRTENWLTCVLVYFAAAGSVLVSYVKARAEGLGFKADVGILTRLERYLVLGPGLVFNIPIISLWIVAILANFTALQRIYHVRKQAYKSQL